MFKYSLITAAGRGSRLMPLTQYMPKALVEVNGTPLITRLIRQMKPHIPHNFVTAGYLGSDLARHVMQDGISGIYNTNGKGNGWWLFNTPLQLINEPVLVLTCDLVVDLDLKMIYDFYINAGMPPCMMLPIHPVVNVEGHFIHGHNGIVQSVSRAHPSEYFASGIYVINPFLVNSMMDHADEIDEVWNTLISCQSLRYSGIYHKYWDTVNTIEQLQLTNQNSQLYGVI